MNTIESVLRLKWYAIFVNMQISGQICKLMSINVEIQFLLINSVKKEFFNLWVTIIFEINYNFVNLELIGQPYFDLKRNNSKKCMK